MMHMLPRVIALATVVSLVAFKGNKLGQGRIYCTNNNGVCQSQIDYTPCIFSEGTLDPCGNGSNKVYVIGSGNQCMETPSGTRFCVTDPKE